MEGHRCYAAYGDLMFRIRDRHEREFVLGPTQEEVVAELAQQELPSYRDLPANVYQVEWKYRDEFRPRYGLLRAREFLMKDAYSIDRDEDGMRASYQAMYDAYVKVFDRLGLDYVIVEADPGQIGGGVNHEFMALADVGEDLFVRCENGDYLADTEAATPRPPEPVSEDPQPLTEVETPGAVTIELMVEQMGLPADAMKCILFDVEGRTVAVLVPGDREVNEEKLARLHFPERVRPFDDEDFAQRGFAKGFVGPQGLGDDVTIFADPAIRGRAGWATGANRTDVHVTGATLDRDFRVDRWEDLVRFREATGVHRRRSARDRPIDRRRPHLPARHVLLGAARGDVPGRGRDPQAVRDGLVRDRDHADHGGRRRAAPRRRRDRLAEAARSLRGGRDHGQRRRSGGRPGGRADPGAREQGIEAILDDRTERAGVKFADADLVGYPVQSSWGRGVSTRGPWTSRSARPGNGPRRPSEAYDAAHDALRDAP